MDRYRRAVRPIYRVGPRCTPAHEGTGVFITFADKRYLLTAAHVVDVAETDTLNVAAGGKMHPIEGHFTITKITKSNRENDKYDFAFLEVENKFEGEEDIEYVDIADAQPEPYNEKTVYLAIGYPNSQNKKFNEKEKTVAPKIWSYLANDGTKEELAPNFPESGLDHIFLGFGKYSKDHFGQQVSSIEPRGMSGGLLVDLGSIHNPDAMGGVHLPKPRPAGLLIEGSKSTQRIISTKLATIRSCMA